MTHSDFSKLKKTNLDVVSTFRMMHLYPNHTKADNIFFIIFEIVLFKNMPTDVREE